MTARSLISRNTRGFGLPDWASGVMVPTSANPQPSPSTASGTRASLSNPAAIPIGLGNPSPSADTASRRSSAPGALG